MGTISSKYDDYCKKNRSVLWCKYCSKYGDGSHSFGINSLICALEILTGAVIILGVGALLIIIPGSVDVLLIPIQELGTDLFTFMSAGFSLGNSLWEIISGGYEFLVNGADKIYNMTGKIFPNVNGNLVRYNIFGILAYLILQLIDEDVALVTSFKNTIGDRLYQFLCAPIHYIYNLTNSILLHVAIILISFPFKLMFFGAGELLNIVVDFFKNIL